MRERKRYEKKEIGDTSLCSPHKVADIRFHYINLIQYVLTWNIDYGVGRVKFLEKNGQ
jgi:hypothetical protein